MKYLSILALFLLGTSTSFSANITVTNTNDSGVGSLRNAVSNITTMDTIFFDNAINNGTITLLSEIIISGGIDFIIQGPINGDSIMLSGGNTNRIFNISTANDFVTINNINLIDGYSVEGGAIYNNGGGAILNYCRIYNNNCYPINGFEKGGGAILNMHNSYFRLANCEIFNNNCIVSGLSTSSLASGGAIYNVSTAFLEIYNSSIYNNKALHLLDLSPNYSEASGGAIFSSTNSILNINYCTLSYNSSLSTGTDGQATGGAICLISLDTAIINTCTINSNSVNGQSPNTRGGNLYSLSSPLGLINTIIANGNSSVTNGTDDIYTSGGNGIISSGNNLIELVPPTWFTIHNTDIIADPKLDTLKYVNNSFVKAHQLLHCSPAYNKGNNSNALTLDQLGQNRIMFGTMDIGAVESQVELIPLPIISADFFNSTLTVNSFTSYQWYVDGNLITGEIGQTITPTQNGNYTIEVVDSLGCSNMSDSFNLTSLGIEQNEKITISIFQNPTKGNINITITQNSDITIFNSFGKLIYFEKLNSGNNEIDLSNFSNGTYFIEIVSGNNVSTHKIIKI